MTLVPEHIRVPILCVLHVLWNRQVTSREGTSCVMTDRQLWVNDGSFHHMKLKELSPYRRLLSNLTKAG
jgi:hypothetical protein